MYLSTKRSITCVPIGFVSVLVGVLRFRAAMSLEVLQRFTWNCTPREIGDLFRSHKNRREARAVIFSHVFGSEDRLLAGSQLEIVQTQVCRTQEEVLGTGEQWRAAMIEKGWL